MRARRPKPYLGPPHITQEELDELEREIRELEREEKRTRAQRDQWIVGIALALVLLAFYWLIGAFEGGGYDPDADLPPKEWWMG